MRNAYSDEFAKFDSEIKSKLIGGVKNFSEQTRRETIGIQLAYQKIAASLDPVVANTIKYQRAEIALTAALKAGIITQEQHNRSLTLAKEKYLSVHASTSTWREEMQRLSGLLGPFSSQIANLTSVADGIHSALTKSSDAVDDNAAAVGKSTSAFSALASTLGSLAPLLLAVAAAAGSVYVAVEVFQFLKTAVSEGVETQKVIERLNNTLRSTGSYAKLSAADLVTLAESYELLSGKSKEEIIAAETILSRFETLNNQTYPEALKVTLAYSKAMGVSADAAANKLGPALEGNTRALGSLKEAGIVLNTEQRKTFQAMVDGGKIAEYQAYLLEILRQKVGELSTEYDKNLIRQVDRANIVFNDFQESIANEVIPALEDVFNELIRSLGGWDALKKTVNDVGGTIGNFIRTAIYGVVIGYYEWLAAFDTLVAGILKGAAAIVKAHATVFRSVSSMALGARLSQESKEAAADAISHGMAIARLSKNLAEHRVALEGDTKVYESHGNVLDSIIGKNAELERQTEELTDIYTQNTLELQKIYDLRMLAIKGPMSLETRLAEEKKINDAHERRVELLKLEGKFGKEIAEELMKVKDRLKDLALKAKLEIEMATKLEPIKINVQALVRDSGGTVNVNSSYTNEIIANEERNREEFAKTFQAYDEMIESTAETWRENLKSMGEISEEEIGRVKQAVIEGLLSVAEGERAIAMIREQQYSDQINQWAGFLSQLGDQLGGFFSQIASLAQSVQGVNSTAQSLGGWTSMMGAWGGTIAAFVAAYQYADAIITKHKGEKYGTRSDLGITGGIHSTSYGSRAGMELSHAMEEILKALEDSLRISVEDLKGIEIRVRNNGESVQAWVKGVWVGTFSDVNTAMKEALLIAMQDPETGLRGISDLMSEGLSAWTSPDMEGMLEFLTDLRSISDLSLSPAVIQLQSAFLEFNRMRDALNKLDQSSKAVIDAQKKLTEAQNYLFEQTKAQLLGIDLTAADAIKNLAGFNEGMQHVSDTAVRGIETALHAAERELKKIEDEAKKGEVRRSGEGGGGKGTNTGTGTGGPAAGGDLIVNVVTFADTLGGVSETVETEADRLKGVIAEYKRQLSEVPKALTENEIDLGIFTALESSLRASGKHADLIAKFEAMRVDAQFQALKLQLIAIGAWERWSAIWQELYDQAMKTAGKGGRVSSAGNNEKDQVRDFIRDKNFELSLIGLTDYQKSLKELDKQYEDLFKQAGKDKKLRDELIALKEKELQQLARENKLRTVNSFKEFLGLVTPFDKVRKTAQDLIKEISASPFGDARKAAMIGRVLEETERQLDKLAKEMSVSLFGSLISDMERFGATDAQMMEARKQMAILEHGLRMENYRLTIAQLEAEGRVSAEVIAAFKKSYDFLAGIDPTKFISPAANDNDRNSNSSDSVSYVSQAYDDFQDRLKKVQDTLAEWNRVPLSETLSRAHELTDSFSALMEDVNKLIPYGWNYTAQAQEAYKKLVRDFVNDTLGEFEESGSAIENELLAVRDRFIDITAALIHLGATQEDLQRTEEARLTAVRRVLDQYLAPIKEHREGRNIGERSTLTGEQQFKLAQEQFRDLFADIQSGDLSRLDKTVDLASQYEELMRSFTGGEGLRFGLKEIDDTLLAIENLVPGFAAQMSEVGSESNPMNVDSASMVNAIHDNMEAVNAGNNLMLAELRETVSEMKKHTTGLNNIESAIISTGSVRNIA